MKYYKKLYTPGFEKLSEEALAFVLERPSIYHRQAGVNLISADFDDAIKEMPSLSIFDVYGIKATDILFFVMYNNHQCGIHSDGWKNNARINVPVLNCAGSILEFWEDVEWKPFRNARGSYVNIARAGTGKFVESVEINSPTVVSVNAPHRVVMLPSVPVPRITLSIDFDICPSFLL